MLSIIKAQTVNLKNKLIFITYINYMRLILILQ